MQSFKSFLTLDEGVFDPGILKAIFMAGGPGSGKSTKAEELFGLDAGFKSSFSHYGLKVVNSDHMFEYLLKQMHVSPKDLANIEREDPARFLHLTADPHGPRARAKALVDRQRELYIQGRLGMIIDGTGDDYAKVATKKHHLEDYGYDTGMVFVHTSLEVALERNRQRPRQLPDGLVTDIWHNCQKNREHYQKLFGKHYVEVYNTTGGVVHQVVQRAVQTFIHTPVQNPKGQAWVRSQTL